MVNLNETSTGTSVALMSTDVEKLIFGFKFIHEAIWSIAAVPFGFYLLYLQVGLARQKVWLGKTQQRVQFTSSVISSMRGVKMMGLVRQIQQKIEALRIAENDAALRWRVNITLGNTLSSTSNEGSKYLTFLLFAIIEYSKKGPDGHAIDVKTLFTSLALLNLVLERMERVIQSMPSIINAFGCFVRIEKFLMQEAKSDDRLLLQRQKPSHHLPKSKDALVGLPEPNSGDIEMQQLNQMMSPTSSTPIIQLRHLNAGWNRESQVLKDLTCDILPSQLTMVIGP
ncbi:hypothetical protein AA313_de0207598 [Arthrobotrys entomopaga]|nr:hypothetical protein AA313_de0207598 [Arthrobotrys entomopaga]